jgi:hypothetical protein
MYNNTITRSTLTAWMDYVPAAVEGKLQLQLAHMLNTVS